MQIGPWVLNFLGFELLGNGWVFNFHLLVFPSFNFIKERLLMVIIIYSLLILILNACRNACSLRISSKMNYMKQTGVAKGLKPSVTIYCTCTCWANWWFTPLKALGRHYFPHMGVGNGLTGFLSLMFHKVLCCHFLLFFNLFPQPNSWNGLHENIIWKSSCHFWKFCTLQPNEGII